MSEPREGPPSAPAAPREALHSLLLRSPLALTVLCPLTFVASLLLLETPGRHGDAFWHSPKAWLVHALTASLPVLYGASLFTALGSHRLAWPGTSTRRRAVVLCTALMGVLGLLPLVVVLLTPPLLHGFPVDVDALAQMPGVKVKLALLGILGAAVTVPQFANCFGIHIQLIGALREFQGTRGEAGELDAAVPRYQQLRTQLRRALGFIAAHIGSNILVLGAVRNLLLEALPSRQDVFPASFVLACGVYLTGLLASVYLPARHTLTAVGEALADRLVRNSLGVSTSWKEWAEERHAVRPYLGLHGSVLQELQDGITVLSPLVASISSLFLGKGG